MSHTMGDRYNYRFKVVMNNDIHVHVFAHMCNIVHTCTRTVYVKKKLSRPYRLNAV